MSTRSSRRAQGDVHLHHGAYHPIVEPRPETQPPVRPKNPKVTFTEGRKPPRELVDINTVLHVPDSPYGIDEIHFLLWYTLTTTLSPDKIAGLFNRFFKPVQPADRWAIADIFNVIETRWRNNGKTFGENFRLVRPREHGTCPCDFPEFHIDCPEVKRTIKTRQNLKYLTIAASLWDQSAAELVVCPRGRRKDQPDNPVTPEPHSTTLPSDPITTSLREAWHQIYVPARMTAAFAFWLSMLNLWFAPPDSLVFPLQHHLSACLHSHPAIVLAVLHFLFEYYFDGIPNFSHLRVMLFGEFVGHACLCVAQTAVAFQAALVLCTVLGGLPNFNPAITAWPMAWTPV